MPAEQKPVGGFRPCNAAGGRSLNGYFLPSISMAKTRATVRRLADQRHIIRHSQTLMAHELAPKAELSSAER